jgi:hypothetical protein
MLSGVILMLSVAPAQQISDDSAKNSKEVSVEILVPKY